MARKAILTDSNKVFICENLLLTTEVIAKKIKKPIELVKEYHEKILSLRVSEDKTEQVNLKEKQKPLVYKHTVTMTDAASNAKTSSGKRKSNCVHYTSQKTI